MTTNDMREARLIYAALLSDMRVERFAEGLLKMPGSKLVSILSLKNNFATELATYARSKSGGVKITDSKFNSMTKNAFAESLMYKTVIDADGKAGGVPIMESSFKQAVKNALAEYCLIVIKNNPSGDPNKHVLYEVVLRDCQWAFMTKEVLERTQGVCNLEIANFVQLSSGDFNEYWDISDFVSDVK